MKITRKYWLINTNHQCSTVVMQAVQCCAVEPRARTRIPYAGTCLDLNASAVWLIYFAFKLILLAVVANEAGDGGCLAHRGCAERCAWHVIAVRNAHALSSQLTGHVAPAPARSTNTVPHCYFLLRAAAQLFLWPPLLFNINVLAADGLLCYSAPLKWFDSVSFWQ